MVDTMNAADLELEITRVFDAPRELLFEAWTNPDHIAKWFGPTGFTAVSCTIKLVEGGRWRTCISDGKDEYWSSGVYREIVRPELLVFTFAWEEPKGTPGRETLVTVTFAERGEHTEMRFHQAAFETIEARDNHTEGWAECFADLASYLAEWRNS